MYSSRHRPEHSSWFASGLIVAAGLIGLLTDAPRAQGTLFGEMVRCCCPPSCLGRLQVQATWLPITSRQNFTRELVDREMIRELIVREESHLNGI